MSEVQRGLLEMPVVDAAGDFTTAVQVIAAHKERIKELEVERKGKVLIPSLEFKAVMDTLRINGYPDTADHVERVSTVVADKEQER